MADTKRGPGRPPSENPRTHRIPVRVHDAEREAIEAAARRAGMPVAQWLREVAMGAARLSG